MWPPGTQSPFLDVILVEFPDDLLIHGQYSPSAPNAALQRKTGPHDDELWPRHYLLPDIFIRRPFGHKTIKDQTLKTRLQVRLLLLQSGSGAKGLIFASDGRSAGQRPKLARDARFKKQ